MVRLLLLTLGIAGLTACGPQLIEGTYSATIDVAENTCPLDDDDLGDGDSVLFIVSWEEDELVLENADGGTFETGPVEDDSFSYEGSSTSDINGSCYLAFDWIGDGVIIDSSSFEISEDYELSAEGDCSGVDTTGLPCSFVYDIYAELRD